MEPGNVVGPNQHCERFCIANNFVVGVLLGQRIQSLAAELTLQPEAAVATSALNANVIANVQAVHRETVVADAAVGLATWRANVAQAGQRSAEIKMDCLPLDGAHSGHFLNTNSVV